MAGIDPIRSSVRQLMPSDFQFEDVTTIPPVPKPKTVVDTIINVDAKVAPQPSQETNARKNVSWADWLMPWNWFGGPEETKKMEEELVGKERPAAEDLDMLLNHWEEVANQTGDEFKRDFVNVYRLLLEVMKRQRQIEDKGADVDLDAAKQLTDRKRIFDKKWSEFQDKYREKLEATGWINFIQRGLEIAGLVGTSAVAVAKGTVSSLTLPGLIFAGAILVDDIFEGKMQKEAGRLLARAIGYVTGRATTEKEQEYWNSWIRMITHLVGPAVNMAGAAAQQAAQAPQAALDMVTRYGNSGLAYSQAAATGVSARVQYLTGHAQADEETARARLTRVGEETERLLSYISGHTERSNQIMRDMIEMKRLEHQVVRQLIR